jgi:hypothetical protein
MKSSSTPRFHTVLHSSFILASIISFSACSAEADGGPATGASSADQQAAASTTAPTAQDEQSGDGSSGSLLLIDEPMDEEEGPAARTEQCDENGENCTCLTLALMGTLDSAATDTDTGAFTEWMNGNSGGSAVVTNVSEKPLLNAEYLAQFDILVLANINGWTFSEEEKQAVNDWVTVTGGGIISLTGFKSDAQEVIDTSQLISFSGLTYAGSGQADWTANNGQNSSVTYQDGTEDLKNCLPSDPNGGAVITTAIPITPQTGELETLSASLDYVGAFIGWGVSAPDDATILATDPMSNKTIAAVKQVGAGKVFVFGDEWVIFRNQWEGTSTNGDPKCSVDGMGGDEKHGVDTLYQTKQFWYNAISWVAPPNECFQITDTDVVIR